MNEKTTESTPEHWLGEGLISAISVGGFLVLIGIMFVLNENLWGNIVNFVQGFSTVQVSGTTIFLPSPTNPAAHAGLYSAVAQFAIGLGILQILILALRLSLHSRIRRIAQTSGSLVFWFGASFLINAYLNNTTTQETWFLFWAAIVMLSGVSLIIRALVLFARRPAR